MSILESTAIGDKRTLASRVIKGFPPTYDAGIQKLQTMSGVEKPTVIHGTRWNEDTGEETILISPINQHAEDTLRINQILVGRMIIGGRDISLVSGYFGPDRISLIQYTIKRGPKDKVITTYTGQECQNMFQGTAFVNRDFNNPYFFELHPAEPIPYNTPSILKPK